MWYYYVAFTTEAGKLRSCRIDSQKELTDKEKDVEIPKAIQKAYGNFAVYECVLPMQAPAASILIQGGTVSAAFSTLSGLVIDVFDLDLVSDGTTTREQELRGNLTAGKQTEIGVTNHYEKHG